MMAAANGVEGGIAQLSAQLTQAIAVVELQRATVEESILRLFAEAQQLNQVSDALCQAASTQGTVLVHLQQLLQNANAPAGMVQALAPAAQGIAAAHQVLAAPATPPQPAVREWEVGQPNGPNQGDTVWHDGQQCSVQYINSKGLLDLRNQGGAVFYGVSKVHLGPPGGAAGPSGAAPTAPAPAPAPPPAKSAVREWNVGEQPGPQQGDVVWHDGQQCTVQYVNSKGLLDLRNTGGAVFYGVAKVQLGPPAGPSDTVSHATPPPQPQPSSCSESGGCSQPESPRSDGFNAGFNGRGAQVAPVPVPVPKPPPRPAVVEPDMSSDDEGIEYVKNLKIGGSQGLGGTLEVTGEFVGTPSCQWYRVAADGKVAAIDGATELSRQVTVDDLGCSLKIECVGPFGGKEVTASTGVIQADPATRGELQKMQRKGEGQFNVHVVPGNEQRIVKVDKKKVQVTGKGMKGRGGKNYAKAEYTRGVQVHLDVYDDKLFQLQIGDETFDFQAESPLARNLLTLLVRDFAKDYPVTGAGAGEASTPSGGDHGGDHGEGEEGACSDGEYMDDQKNEGEGEEEEFKHIPKVVIRDQSQVKQATGDEIKRSMSLFAPPPGAGGRARGRSIAQPPPASLQEAGAAAGAAAPARSASDPPAESGELVKRSATMPVRRMQTALPQPPGAAEAAGGEIYADVQPGGGGGAGVSAVERAAQQECASRGKPSASAEKNGSSTSGSSGGGGGGEGWYNLQLIERVNALFDGDSLRKFQVEGELRAQQLGGFGAVHRFALHLESTTNVHKVELNKKLCRDDADAGGRAHAYQVALPAVQEAKQLPLLRYESAPKFQPIPLRILLRWKFDEGRDKLEIRAATNPALKYGLKDVVLLVHVHDDVTGCQSKPQGEWKPHVLTWRVALLPPGKPSSFVAEFATPPGVSKEGRKAAPVQVSFACEDRCITGVTAKAADSAPVAAVLRKFQAGKYMVGPPLKDAPPKPAEG